MLSNNCGWLSSGHTAIQELLDTRKRQVDGCCWEASEVRGGGVRLRKASNLVDVCDCAYGTWGARATRAGVVLDAAAEGDEFDMETSARGRELRAAAGGRETWSVSCPYLADRHRTGNGELRGTEKCYGSVREESGD